MSERTWVHGGLEAFSKGWFEDGGSNLYVNARGVIETIHRTDINNDGYVDIVLPNAQGYVERGPTWIYKPGSAEGKDWERRELPHDSGTMSHIVDLDGDGYLDLIVANSRNGVTAELDSYIYWGGPKGLTGERTDLPTVGAYNVAVADVNRDGRLDLVFPSAWVDHHNPGQPRLLHVYLQESGRKFEDASQRYGLIGMGARSVASADLNGDGLLDLVVANFRCEFATKTDSFVYWGTEEGFDTEAPLRLPTDAATHVFLADLNDDGRKEIVFCSSNRVQIYWNDQGRFSADNVLPIETEGLSGEFHFGAIFATAADVNGDGRNELIVATVHGVQVHAWPDLQKVQQFLPLKYACWVHAADLNGDGRPELIVGKNEDGESFNTDSVVYWNGPEGLSDERKSLLATRGVEGITAGDLDGDGKPVIVFNNTMAGPAKNSPTLPSYIYFGSKDADYGTKRRLVLPVGGGSACGLSDIYLNGVTDLVFCKHGGLRVFPGGPDGPCPDTFIDLLCDCQTIQVADFNRDGYLDILAIRQTYDDRPETMADSSRIFYGSAQGFNPERVEILPTYCSGDAYLADIDKDGYLDIIVGDKRGYILIYLGGPEGYSPDRVWKIPMWSHWKGAVTAAADLNHNGWLDLVVRTYGHLLRTQDTLTIFYGGPDGYSWDNAQDYKGGYTPGKISVADLNNNGNLDLIVPAYSTDLTRVKPVQVFWNNGETFDLEHPLELPADSGFAVLPVDLSRNGYIDLMVACHRNDQSHQVDSIIYWNGPQGLSVDRVTRFPGMGPHRMNVRDPGNAYTRDPVETFISPPRDSEGRSPVRINWDAEVPEMTALQFQLRCADNEEALDQAPWLGPAGQGTFYETPGEEIRGLRPKADYIQYRALFTSLYGCRSPRLSEVRIDFQRNGH